MKTDLRLIATFGKMIDSATIYLGRHVDLVNNMNVFPVPDGDTGTNMFNTLNGIKDRTMNRSRFTHLSDYLNEVSQAALYEGRGNSGIILSQILQGFASEFNTQKHLTTQSFASCLEKARESAYESVGKPVEGTILTVLSDISDVASNKAKGYDICELFEQITVAAGISVHQTTDLLDKLREAEVVDSGGYGLEIIISGMNIALQNGNPLTYPMIIREPGHDGQEIKKIIAHTQSKKDEYGLCIQFILNSTFNSSDIKKTLSKVASSTVVVGSKSIFKIHAHGNNYDEVMEVSRGLGDISDISTQNMDEQASEVLNQTVSKNVNTASAIDFEGSCALVTVGSGLGITDLFYDLGATIVIDGGDSMNPSVSEYLSAMQNLDAEVLILPNNKNIITTAHQASNLSDKTSLVLETQTVQQGLECVFDFNPDLTAAENISTMENIRQAVHSFSIFKSTRTVKLNGTEIKEGQTIGMKDGELTQRGENPEIVLHKILKNISTLDFERIIVIAGDSISSGEVSGIISRINLEFSSLEDTLEVIHGGQPHYDYLISAIGNPNQ